MIWLGTCAAGGSLPLKRVKFLLSTTKWTTEVSAMKNYAPEKILLGLICIELILIALFALLGLRYDFFHLNREKNLPTWFSSVQLLFVAYCSLITANKESMLKKQDVFIKSQAFWYVMAIGFAFLSLDEFTEIHEMIKKQGRTPVWVVLYAPIAFLVALYSGYETLKRRHLSSQLPYFFGISFLVMGGGAFAAEWIGFHMPTKVLYGIAMVTEEFCEMLGVSIIIYTLLLYSRQLEHIASRGGLVPVS
jgi:hypothetical protein